MYLVVHQYIYPYIYLMNISNNCFTDIPVLITNYNKKNNFTAFFTHTRLLRKSSRKITCSNKTIDLNMDNKYLVKITDQEAI